MSTVAQPRGAARGAAPSPRTVSAPPRATVLRALVHRGLLDNRRAPLVWGGSLGVMSALVALLYPSISDSLVQTTQSYPEGLKQAFGMTDMGTIEAFLSAEMFSLFLPLAVAYFAIRCVATAIVGAEERGYPDTVLANPVSRSTFVAGGFLTAAILVAATLAVVGGLTAAGALMAGEPIGAARLAGALAGVWALALFFAGCATLASGLLHRAAPVIGAGAGLLGAMYLLDVLGKLAPAVSDLRWLSAFRYYGAPLTDGLAVGLTVVLVAAATLLAAAGAVLYQRRDITG